MTPQELTALKLKFYDALVCDPELSAIALRVAWLVLSRYLNARSLVAWPSAETLAGDLGSSLRNVWRAIEQLTKQRWFVIERGGGRGHSNVYSANFERVTELSPFPAQTATGTGDTLSPVPETVTGMVVNSDRNGRETVTDLSPDSLLREPFEEPFEGARARAGNPGHSVRGFGTADQKDARQGDRGGGANRSQGEVLYSFDGGNQPSWPTWVAWLQELGMTERQARRWLAKWGDDLGWDEVDRRLQRIRDAGPTGQGGLNDRMVAEGAVREPGQADVA